MLTWEVSWWFSILVRLLVTASAMIIFVRLLREGFTTTRVNSVFLGVIVLGVLWLADIEGATRLKFLGIEIDKRVDAARKILGRLKEIETAAEKTTGNLERVHQEATKTATELREIVRRFAPRFLSQKEIGIISQVLRRYPNNKIKIYRPSDREAGPFADQIIQVFKESGWIVEVSHTDFMGPTYDIHITISTKPNKAIKAAIYALTNISILRVGRSEKFDPDLMVLIVGLQHLQP